MRAVMHLQRIARGKSVREKVHIKRLDVKPERELATTDVQNKRARRASGAMAPPDDPAVMYDRYMQEKRVDDLMSQVVRNLVIDRPGNHVLFIINFLERTQSLVAASGHTPCLRHPRRRCAEIGIVLGF